MQLSVTAGFSPGRRTSFKWVEMGEDRQDGSPYPPRTSGYVDCLTSSQADALEELWKQLPAAFADLAVEHVSVF